MCRVLKVERSGFYAWLKQPQSTRAREDERLLVMIGEAYLQSGGVYGARNVHRDLTEAGERLGRKRVERLMRERGLRSVRTPRRRRYGGRCTEPSATPVYGRAAGPGVGHGHHVSAHGRRLALSCRRARSLLARRDRLVHEAEPRERARARCVADGDLATSTAGTFDDPLRPGRAVRQR